MKNIILTSALLFLFGCNNSESVSVSSNDMENTIENITLKYPVVLVHGILAEDNEQGGINFWGRIPDRLKQSGIDVYYGNTEALGTIEYNAERIKNTVDTILQQTGSEKVNIIAHSKGGLDSRYFIWKYSYEDKVASLTTISTPHRGAELADFIYNQDEKYSSVMSELYKAFNKLYGENNSDSVEVNYQLTTEYMNEFNENVGMVNEKVYFQSLYTTLENPTDDLMFYFTGRLIKDRNGENDGVVSAFSSGWGNNSRHITSELSHIDIIDVKKMNIRKIYIPDIYVDIVKDLSEKGF